MKHLTSITISLSLLRRTPSLTTITHFSTSSPDATSSYPSHSRRSSNPEDVRNVRVSVWWDFENCQVPCNVNVFKVTQFITSAVRSVGIKGPIQVTAFGDVMQLSRANQEALSSTGINLTHVPNGGKNSADRSLLVDLMYWVSQNPPPAHLFLISGDRDFASTLHRLRMNNYNVLLASTDNAPAVLCSAASIMWQWPSLVKGENLTGRYFNQPPDGPYASWYGHYRVALEDPFAVCNHVSNQTSSVQSDEVSNCSNSDNIRPIPKAVMNAVRSTLSLYPKGIPITELRAELGKSNITIQRDWYGHKKFSAFLMAMPNLLRLQSQKDGQHIVHGISPKSQGPDTVSGQGTTKDLKDLVPVVDVKEDVADNTSVPPKSDDQVLPASSKLDDENVKTESQAIPIKQEQLPQQAVEPPPVIEKKMEKGELNSGQLQLVKINRGESEAGTFKSMWRKWFRGNDGHQLMISHTDTVSVDENSSVSKDQSSSSSANEVVQDAEIGEKSTKSGEKVVRNSRCKPPGIFNRIVKWCKFWESDKKSDDLKAELSKTDEKISEMQEVFTERFWNDMLAFLESSKGSASVLQSKTRQEMVHNFQQFGPSQLQSLTENQISHLMDSLISEKKWVVENPSRIFPFRIVGPSRSSSSTKPSNSKGSTNTDSHGQNYEPEVKTSSKNRSMILRDCQKLVNEVVKEHPDGFKISSFKELFFVKYGYHLEVQQLSYQKLATLLQIMPGVKLECSRIFPSGARVHSKKADLSRKEDDNDTQWEELGPIEQIKTKKDDFETVSDNDLSDSDAESSPAGLQNQAKGKKEESSLLQILDSWYGNKEDTTNRITADGSDRSIYHLNNNKPPAYDDTQKPAKRYSFVADKPVDGNENLINGILGSLKKPGNGSPESKYEG
ncbi:uncharacterized protein LOC143558036 [Bidens hawaiensis]|uniref:uncharacterized protein LOC143558036 n=1 Tax=Bidens hawaiensis TaxID=980011 RepID=UPI00404933A4